MTVDVQLKPIKPGARLNRCGLPVVDAGCDGRFGGIWFTGLNARGNPTFTDERGITFVDTGKRITSNYLDSRP